MTSEYIERWKGGYYIAGTRIFLDSVVPGFCCMCSGRRRNSSAA